MNDTDKTKEDTGVHEEPRVMSRDDVHDYEGLTLNEDGKEEKQEEEDGYTIHIRRFSLKNIPFWKKALFALGLVACAAIPHAGHSRCLLYRSRRCHRSGGRSCGLSSEEIHTVKKPPEREVFYVLKRKGKRFSELVI